MAVGGSKMVVNRHSKWCRQRIRTIGAWTRNEIESWAPLCSRWSALVLFLAVLGTQFPCCLLPF